jgi:hypothetical protein
MWPLPVGSGDGVLTGIGDTETVGSGSGASVLLFFIPVDDTVSRAANTNR